MAGLIRVGDVTDNEVRTPSLFFTGPNETKLQSRVLVRSGDVVVTTSGTVGRVGVITDETASAGALASNGIAVIRTRAGTRPQFVAALLRAPAYQNWLSGHARGLANQYLSVRTLRTLTIPVPSEDVQDAVLLELAGPRADALAVLLRSLSGNAHPGYRLVGDASCGGVGCRRDRRSGWLEYPCRDRRRTAVDGHSCGVCRRRLQYGRPVKQRMVGHSSQGRGALQDILSIPTGSGRLAVLEFAAARFHEALGVLDPLDEASASRRLRSATLAMAKIAEQEVHNMQSEIHLEVDVSPTEVATGVATEVRLLVTNASAVPLRHVRVTARHSDGTVDADGVVYLAEGQNHEIPLVVQPKEETQPAHITVAWQARRLDSIIVRGETTVSLLVRSSDDVGGRGDLGASPYIVGSPVDRDAMFFGRTGVMDQIRRPARRQRSRQRNPP